MYNLSLNVPPLFAFLVYHFDAAVSILAFQEQEEKLVLRFCPPDATLQFCCGAFYSPDCIATSQFLRNKV
jgi:hypothetical protein